MILPTAPTWPQLASLLPAAAAAAPDPAALTLHRERNGWCVRSATIWLALEVKGVPYATVREMGSSAPALHWPDATVQTDSVEVLRTLDAALPSTTPLWPPAGIEAGAVDDMVGAFAATMPAARESDRAAYLFCAEEGSLYDPLPRATFVATLDAAEELLGRHGGGPFFCGGSFSAADAVWAPLLERYAAQLPCLHEGKPYPYPYPYPPNPLTPYTPSRHHGALLGAARLRQARGGGGPRLRARSAYEGGPLP